MTAWYGTVRVAGEIRRAWHGARDVSRCWELMYSGIWPSQKMMERAAKSACNSRGSKSVKANLGKYRQSASVLCLCIRYACLYCSDTEKARNDQIKCHDRVLPQFCSLRGPFAAGGGGLWLVKHTCHACGGCVAGSGPPDAEIDAGRLRAYLYGKTRRKEGATNRTDDACSLDEP